MLRICSGVKFTYMIVQRKFQRLASWVQHLQIKGRCFSNSILKIWNCSASKVVLSVILFFNPLGFCFSFKSSLFFSFFIFSLFLFSSQSVFFASLFICFLFSSSSFFIGFSSFLEFLDNPLSSIFFILKPLLSSKFLSLSSFFFNNLPMRSSIRLIF